MSSRTHRARARAPPTRTPSRRRRSASGARVFVPPPMRRASSGGGRSSARRTPCSSTGPAAATATTTRRGSSRGRSARSSARADAKSVTRECWPRERRLCLLQALPRRRPRRRDRGLRRHSRPRPAGRDAPARHPGATHRQLSFDRRVPGARVEAHARLHRAGRGRRWAERLPCRRQRRPRRGADDLPLALACARRGIVGEDGMSRIAEMEEEIKEAMKAHDAERRDALRLIVNALKNSEKELQRPLSEDEELQVLQRERKKRVEAAEAFRNGGREEQADSEERELAVLEEFMPAPLSEDEIEDIVDDAIAEVGATSMADLGRVMADVMPQIAGRADGSVVSQMVREKLA